MKKVFIILFLTLSIVICKSQTKSRIDSLNNIPFETKLEKASSLDDDYLLNAQNANKINYQLGEAQSYSNLSLVYYFQGKYQYDLQYSLKAIAVFETIGEQEKLSQEFGELGYRMKKRNMTKALYYMQKGLKIAETKKYQQPLLSIYNNYGVLKEMQNQNDSALYFYNKGLKIKEKINDSLGIPYSLNNIAGIYAKTNRFEEAKHLYDKALSIRLKLKDQYGICENYTYFGDLYFAQKNYNEAIKFYQKSLVMAHQYHFLDIIQSNYKLLSENYEKVNNKEEALFNFKKYSQYKDSLLNKETNSKIAELEVKFETNKKEKLLLEKDIQAKKTRFKLIATSVLAVFIGLIGFLIYRQQKLKNQQLEQEFKLKSAISQIETQEELQQQRLRISRDLHDNIGAQLTFIISSVENIKYAFDLKNVKLDDKLINISNFTKATILELRDTIWAMNSNEITFDELRSRVLNFIEKAKNATETIDFKFTIDESLSQTKLTSIVSMNIYRTIQESINNAIKYADAKQINVAINKVESAIKITIHDDGKGFDIATTEKGYGMQNMQKRIEDIGGNFRIESEINQGTTILVLINNLETTNF